VISPEGTIAAANAAFVTLVGGAPQLAGGALADTALARMIPSLMGSVRRAYITKSPHERRALVAPDRELVVWIVPTPTDEQLHVLIRVGKPELAVQRDR
jgi:hypothetical protein